MSIPLGDVKKNLVSCRINIVVNINDVQRKWFAVSSLKVDSSLQVIVRSEAFEKTSATDGRSDKMYIVSKNKYIMKRDTHGPSCKENSVAENIVFLARELQENVVFLATCRSYIIGYNFWKVQQLILCRLDILEVLRGINTTRSMWILGSGFIPWKVTTGAWCPERIISTSHNDIISLGVILAVLAADLVSTLIRDAW